MLEEFSGITESIGWPSIGINVTTEIEALERVVVLKSIGKGLHCRH